MEASWRYISYFEYLSDASGAAAWCPAQVGGQSSGRPASQVPPWRGLSFNLLFGGENPRALICCGNIIEAAGTNSNIRRFLP